MNDLPPHDRKRFPPDEAEQLAELRLFYDSVYHATAEPRTTPSRHLRRLARRVGIRAGQQVLDVACGVGEWLLACDERGASVCGVDISARAIAACRAALPQGEFHVTPAESLPFADGRFDVVTCFGSLEHFVSPVRALREMVRVARREAIFLLLVPNADFLTRRLGLFSGTGQADVREEVRTLREWEVLFDEAGLKVESRWRDLHVLSWSWIAARGWGAVPVRAAQAAALLVWPLKWQYQVYYLCSRRLEGAG